MSIAPDSTPTMFCLYKDDDGHSYVIPADKVEEADTYFAAVYAAWAPGGDGDEPHRPEWITEVGGAPSLVRFPSFEIA